MTKFDLLASVGKCQPLQSPPKNSQVASGQMVEVDLPSLRRISNDKLFFCPWRASYQI
jgi:hypothetical protein